MSLVQRSFIVILVAALASCGPSSGPDKTVGGTVLGAAWGAGAGAVVGNQTGNMGGGAAVGAGLGAAAGMLQGAALDIHEATELRQEEELASLRLANEANERELQNIQHRLDVAATRIRPGSVIHQVFFDAQSSSLRAGAIANLEVVADQLRADPAASVLTVSGHSDDEGTPDENERLAESRARAVSSYLGGRGISMDQIIIKSYGSTRPLLSNNTAEGRETNRRVDVIIGRVIDR